VTNKNFLRANNPNAFQSHQFNLQQQSIPINININESEFDFNPKNLNNLNTLELQEKKNLQIMQIQDANFNFQNNLLGSGDVTNNNLRNAYTIIYDQANSIQILQEKVTKLQTELENVASKLKNQSEEKSLNSSCGNRQSNERKIAVISTATNTSLDLIQNYMDNSAFNYSNKSITNIIAAANNHLNSKEENSSTTNKVKSEEDYRYDVLLNDNSINFPKQFLDIDSKQYDSHREDTHNTHNNNNNNSNLNSHQKESSNYRELSCHRKNFNCGEQQHNGFKNINSGNSNLIHNVNSNNYYNNMQISSINPKKNTNTSIQSGVSNNNNSNSLNDFSNQDNVNLVSFNNANAAGNSHGTNHNQTNLIMGNFQSNSIVYSTDFALNNKEMKRMGHNMNSREINENKNIINNNNSNKNNNYNLDCLYNQTNNSNINNNLNLINYKKEKSVKSSNKIINNNVFSTINSLDGAKDEDEFCYNIPFNPNKKYQTIDNSSNAFRVDKDQNTIKRSDSDSGFFNNNNSNTPVINKEKQSSAAAFNENLYYHSKKQQENNSKNSSTTTERKNPIPTYIPNANSTSNNNIINSINNNINSQLLANSFITHLDKLNDSSYIAAHDLDNKINFECTNENEIRENEKEIKISKQREKSQIEIPKTYVISCNNLDLTGNDNTSINYDYSQSIDPGTQRLFLKAPSMLCKTNNSISREDNDYGKMNNKNKIVSIKKLFF